MGLKGHGMSNMANILTSVRIVCGLLILYFPPFSKWYYILYLLGGLTDAVDGTVARRLGTVTDSGAKFDTAADFIFAVAVIIKLVNAFRFPMWLLIWIALIFAIKTLSVITGLVRHKKLVAVHSLVNKVCGAAVYILPLVSGFDYPREIKLILTAAVSLLASVASVDEFIKVLKGKTVE